MNIQIENQQKKFPPNRRQIRSTLQKLLRHLGREDGELSVLLVDDEGIREINRRFLNRDRPTNVISFAMTEGRHGDITPQLLGDIVISLEAAKREGEANGLTLSESIDFLLIHGLLHLLGYEHEGGKRGEARRMEEKEDELFFLLHHVYLER